MPRVNRENCRRISLKRKVFHKGPNTNHKFKRFKKTLKCIKDNVENQIAKEKSKDIYEFSDSEDDRADELGMGLEISDLPFLNDHPEEQQKELIALTQDTVRPLFTRESEYDEGKLREALAELRLSSFRDNQEETIKRILFGRSTLFISPTGSGKSLCYQLPALLYARYRKYITIVVSPLISLMEDQMSNFPPSLRAVSLHSNHSRQQRTKAIGQLVNGEAQVVFVSPEAIVGGVLDLDDLRNLPPVGFVCIDEAHCLSEWSHNFRPAYLQFFSILREQLNIKTYLALTATASRATSFAISKCLTINPDTDVIGATKVPRNIILSVSCETHKDAALTKLLKTPAFKDLPSLIVYCNRRDTTENVASLIRTSMQNHANLIEIPTREKRNELPVESQQDDHQSPPKPHMKLTWNAEAYHAGLPSEVRKRIQRQFIKGELRVVVATIAFGMGINKSNVRAIIHYDMPSSFESYVQEIGRAGRDGRAAQCHMFLRTNMTDMFYQQRHIYSSIVEKENLKKIIDRVFRPCKCSLSPEDQKKTDKMNENDKHLVNSLQKTDFTNTPMPFDEDDLDEIELIGPGEGFKQPMKYVRQSLVRKHRACHGNHEVAFGIDAAMDATNLFSESIITYICQIQKAYPQLKIQQFAPFKSSCRVYCYKGSKQMKDVAAKCKPISYALAEAKRQAMKLGEEIEETPSEITFDMAEVAFKLGKPVNEVIKMIKKVEWELVEETGRFRRTHVRVKFDLNSFHLRAVGDLDEKERGELYDFLVDYMKKYELIERNKVMKLYKTFKAHNIPVEKMTDRSSRRNTSMSLKKAIDDYFNPLDDQYLADEANMHRESIDTVAADDKSIEIQQSTRDTITKKAHDFILKHGIEHVPRNIAKIFQGISCPNYPAEHWGKNRMWWRVFPETDFLKLEGLIKAAFIQRADQ